MTLKNNWEKNIKFNNTFNSILDLKEPEKNRKYYQETPKKLLFNSDSLFTEKFYEDLSSILDSKNPDASRNFKKRRQLTKKGYLRSSTLYWKWNLYGKIW